MKSSRSLTILTQILCSVWVVRCSWIYVPNKPEKLSDSKSERNDIFKSNTGEASLYDVIPYLPVEGGYNHHADMSECYLDCEYGYESDIEGRSICKCHEPCDSVYCFGATECIAERVCDYESGCSYLGVCKVVDDVCSLKKPKHTFICEKLSRKYYFDVKKGRCRKYWGCDDIVGNSFETKKECKRTCGGPGSSAKNSRKSSLKEKSGSSQYVRSQEVDSDNELSLSMEEYVPPPPPQYNKPKNMGDNSEMLNNNIRHIQSRQPVKQTAPRSENSCLFEEPFQPCPYDQCSHCKNPEIVCLPSLCGKCKALYIDLTSGVMSDQYSAYC